MVENYGAVNSVDAPDLPGTTTAAESSALLGGNRDATVKREGKADGRATIVSCVSNLCNTIIGSGECLRYSLFTARVTD